jgi:hypothetical protein
VKPTITKTRAVSQKLFMHQVCHTFAAQCAYSIATDMAQCAYSIATDMAQCAYSIATGMAQCAYSPHCAEIIHFSDYK